MKVLLTHQHFFPDFAGGGEYVVFETARHLMRKGIDVRVLTTGDPRIESHESVPTIRLPIHHYRLNWAVRPIAKLAREADLVHTFNYHAALPSRIAGWWTGTPVVCTVLGLFEAAWKEMWGPLWGRGAMAWERFLLRRRYARVLFLSEFSRRRGIALGCPESKALVHTPGIDPDEFDPAHEREDTVLFAGKLERRKGVYDVLRVAEALPEVRFVMLGWGPEEEALKRRAPENLWIGMQSHRSELIEAFGRARIFFLPSYAETLGVVLLEAMASGCAVVSSIPMDYEGRTVAAGDVPAMIEAIRELWKNPDQADRLGARNVERARAYTADRYVSGLLETYRTVLDEAS